MMTDRRSTPKCMFCLALLVVLFACDPREPPYSEASYAQTQSGARIDVIAEAALLDQKYPGLSIVILQGDRVLVAKGYGLADLDSRVAATPETIYPIASLSKQFTAAAIMKLVEQGLIGLDDPLTEHLPEFSDPSRATLIRHLLRQTSGIREPDDLPEFAAVHPQGWTEPADFALLPTVRLLSPQPRHYAPGDWWSYSNSNFLLLAALIERVTGMTYNDFLTEAFFDPLGLAATRVCGLPYPDDRSRAVGYDVRNGSLTVRPLAQSTMDPGSGGLCSNATDLAAWMRALVDGRAVSAESYRQMTSVAAVSGGFTPPYGFGLSVVPVAGERAVWHTGMAAGFNSVLIYFPRQDLIMALITNKRAAGISSVASAVARAVMGLSETLPADQPVSTERVSQVVGTYDDHLFRIRIFLNSGRLHAHISKMDITVPLLHQGGSEFATPDPPGFGFRFEPAGGRAERVIFEWAEIHSYGRRIE